MTNEHLSLAARARILGEASLMVPDGWGVDWTETGEGVAFRMDGLARIDGYDPINAAQRAAAFDRLSAEVERELAAAIDSPVIGHLDRGEIPIHALPGLDALGHQIVRDARVRTHIQLAQVHMLRVGRIAVAAAWIMPVVAIVVLYWLGPVYGTVLALGVFLTLIVLNHTGAAVVSCAAALKALAGEEPEHG